MPFKSDRQRKAAFANMNQRNPKAFTSPQMINSKPMLPSERRIALQRENTKRVLKKLEKSEKFLEMSNKELKKKGIRLDPNKDIDRDGIKNKNDCQPLNPKKQGLLHDLAVKRLRKQEEKLEAKREKEMKKLEDIKDRLQERQSVEGKKQDIKTLQLKQKQAIIDETNRERKKINDLEAANLKAKDALDRLTFSGRVKIGVKEAGKAGARVAGKQSKILLKKTFKFLKKQF